MTTTELTSSLADAVGVRVIPIGTTRWRVLDRAGRALGQLVAVGDAGDERFRARRYHPSTGTFRDIGEFWRPAEALECLRLLR